MTLKDWHYKKLGAFLSQQDNRTFIFKNGVYQIDAYAPVVDENIEIFANLARGFNVTYSTINKVDLSTYKKMCIKYHFTTNDNPNYSYVRVLLPKQSYNNINVTSANINKSLNGMLSSGSDGVIELDITEFNNEQYLGVALGVTSASVQARTNNTVQISEWWLE